MSYVLIALLRDRVRQLDTSLSDIAHERKELREEFADVPFESTVYLEGLEEEAMLFGRSTGLIEFKDYLSDLVAAMELDERA